MTKYKLPNVYVAGFSRCGSTFLSELLRQHPDIDIPKLKEIDYFNKKHVILGCPKYKNPRRVYSLEQYSNLFDFSKKIRIDFSVKTAYDPGSAKRIRKTLGDIPIIFLVRKKEYHKKSLIKCLKIWGVFYKKQKIDKNKKDLLEYYSDFEEHIGFYKKNFSNVLVLDLLNKPQKKEIQKLLGFLGLNDYKFDYNVKKNSKKNEKFSHANYLKTLIFIKTPLISNLMQLINPLRYKYIKKEF